MNVLVPIQTAGSESVEAFAKLNNCTREGWVGSGESNKLVSIGASRYTTPTS